MNSYRKDILNLALLLKQNNLDWEADAALALLRKKANLDIQPWYDLYDETNTVEPSPILDNISKFLNSAKYYLDKAAGGLQGATKEDIEILTNYLPPEKIVARANLNRDSLLKISSSQDPYWETAELLHKAGLIQRPDYKKANWWKSIATASGKTLIYVLPFVSLIMAIYNLYYCFIAYQRLVGEMPELGLNWADTLQPEKINQLIEKNKENPFYLKNLTKAVKNIDLFIDEFISSIANTIDGIKDVIFMIANISVVFLPIDLGLSFAIALIEYGAENKALKPYKDLVNKIRQIAILKIEEIQDIELSQTSKSEVSAEEELALQGEPAVPQSKLEKFLAS